MRPEVRFQRGSPSIDIQSVAAWATVIFQATLVITVLVLIVIYTEHQDKVHVLEDSVKSLSRSAERAINYTEAMRRAMPPINMTRVAQKAIAQDEETWINATVSAKRSIRSMGNLIQRMDENHAIERYTKLASTITEILASPKVARHVEVYSDDIIWLLDALKSKSAEEAFYVIKKSVREISEAVKSPETREMVNRFMNSDETTALIQESKRLVSDVRQTVRLSNDVIQQARDHHVVRRTSDLMQQVKDEHLLHKAGRMYDKFERAERRLSKVVKVGYNFMINLLDDEFSGDSSNLLMVGPNHQIRAAIDEDHPLTEEEETYNVK